MSVRERLEFELTHFEATVQRFNHYAIETSSHPIERAI